MIAIELGCSIETGISRRIAPLQICPLTQPHRASPPLGNYAIMLLTTCAFAVQMLLDPSARHLRGLVLQDWSVAGLFGHMWLHMTMVHLVGNLITLWVFGRYVCPKVGNMAYALAYVVAGLGAGIAHSACDGRPLIGASGAIMGILGIYVVICFGEFGRLGPWLVLIWFLATLAAGLIGGSPDAYLSHIGGFLTGMVLGACIVVYRMAVGERTSYGTESHPGVMRVWCETSSAHDASDFGRWC
jgi:membrane associated rhomboid family serine protease